MISTTIRSESTRVPPVTALRSPPASRMTGADSPVMADSSTEAMPSITVPSPGINSPASTITTSPRASSEAGHSPPSRDARRCPSHRAQRVGLGACPRPSASASARLANTTRQPQPQGDGEGEPRGLVPTAQRGPAEDAGSASPTVVMSGADLDDEHDRVACLVPRVDACSGRRSSPGAIAGRRRRVASGRSVIG